MRSADPETVVSSCLCAVVGIGIRAPVDAAVRYTFDTFGTDQGLANLVVTALHRDRTAFLWVGTRNGLYRYDGERFLSFSVAEGLPNAAITTLYEDARGRLWVGTDHGLAWRSGSGFVASKHPALQELIYR